jgi:hypothetical protein
MACAIGFTGNDNSWVKIDTVVYPNESFTPPDRMREKVGGQNNGDEFECFRPTVLKQGQLKVTAFLTDLDYAAIEVLLASKEVVEIETGTMTHVISSVPHYRKEAYEGFVDSFVSSPVSNTEYVKCDFTVQPTSAIVVTDTTTSPTA